MVPPKDDHDQTTNVEADRGYTLLSLSLLHIAPKIFRNDFDISSVHLIPCMIYQYDEVK